MGYPRLNSTSMDMEPQGWDRFDIGSSGSPGLVGSSGLVGSNGSVGSVGAGSLGSIRSGEPDQAGMEGMESIDRFASSIAVDGRSPWNVVPRQRLSPANSLVCNGYGSVASAPVYTTAIGRHEAWPYGQQSVDINRGSLAACYSPGYQPICSPSQGVFGVGLSERSPPLCSGHPLVCPDGCEQRTRAVERTEERGTASCEVWERGDSAATSLHSRVHHEEREPLPVAEAESHRPSRIPVL